MQERRGRPDAVQRAGLVGAQFLYADRQVEAVHGLLLFRRDAGVPVGALLDEGGDVGQALGRGQLREVELLRIGADQLDVHPRQFVDAPAELAQVVAVVGDVVGGGRIGADHLGRHHVHAPLGIASGGGVFRRLHLGCMAEGAVGFEQGAALGGALQVDAAEEVFRPGRRFQLLQGFFQGVQVVQAYAGGVALLALQRLAVLVEDLQARADAEGLADIARHRLHGRAVPLHPVEFPDVPDLRIAHRGVGDAVVARVDGIAEDAVGDAPEGVGAAGAFLGGVEVAAGVVPGGAQQGVEYGLEVGAQLRLVLFVAFAEDFPGEAVELERVVVGGGHARAERLAEGAAAQGRHGGGDGVHGGAAVDAQRLALVAQFAGVAGSAGDVQVAGAGLLVAVLAEAHRQVAGVEVAGLLLRIDEEAEAGEVFGGGEGFFGEGQFEGGEPVVVQAFHQGALGRVVEALAGLVLPLRQVAYLARRLVVGEVGIGDVVDHHPDDRQHDHADNQQSLFHGAHQERPCRPFFGTVMPRRWHIGKLLSAFLTRFS